MSAKLICIPPARTAEVLPLVDSLLLSALEHTGIGDYASIRVSVLAGMTLLWVAFEDGGHVLAAATTQLERSPVGKVCVISACGGRAILEWLHMIDRIEDYASKEGCTRVRYFGRKGWLKELPEYQQIGIIADKAL